METLLCPYPGLRPFDEKEAIFFKGRDTNIDEIIKQIEQKRFVMITGASGDGKSSIVYAGVIPNIKAGFIKATYNAWKFSIIKPEDKPLHNLSNSMAEIFNLSADKVYEDLSYGFSSIIELYKNSDYYIDNESKDWQNLSLEGKKARRAKAANLFILVDQFEEFFTNTENFYNGEPTAESEIAINLLTETVRVANEQKLPIYIVFTMRADFIGNSSAFRGLPELVGFSHFFIPRLKREDMEKIILEPALLNGDSISEQLVNYMTSAAADGADQLPIIQHALNRIWNIARENNEEMDLIHLAMAGGIDPLELSENNRIQFNQFFDKLPSYKKEHYQHPSLQNVINAHADELFADSVNVMMEKNKGDFDLETIQLALKRSFQTLTKIDEGRSVRHRTSVKDLIGNINIPSIGINEINILLRKYREQGNTLINPFFSKVENLNNDSVIDITHEALIRNWKKLHQWVEEDEQHLNDYVDFNKQLLRWQENNMSSRFLLSLGPLEQFESWFKNSFINEYWLVKYDESIDSTEDKFIKAKTKIASSVSYLKQSREEIKNIESRKKRFNRILLAASFAVMLVLSGLTIWAFNQKNYATQQTQLAEQKRKEVEKSKLQAIKLKVEAEKEKAKAKENETKAYVYQQQSFIVAKSLAEQLGVSAQAKALAEKNSAYANEQYARANTEMTNAMNQMKIADEQKEKAMTSEARTKTLSFKALSQQMAYMAANPQGAKDTLSALFALHAWDLHKEVNGEVLDNVIYNGFVEANYYLNGRDYYNFNSSSYDDQLVITEASDNALFSLGNVGELYEWDKLTKKGTMNRNQPNPSVIKNNALIKTIAFSTKNLGNEKLKELTTPNFENVFIDEKSKTLFTENKTNSVSAYSIKNGKVVLIMQFDNFGGMMWGAMPLYNGEKFLIVSKSGIVYIYNSKDKTPEKTFELKEQVLSFAALNTNTCLIGTVKGNIYQFASDGEKTEIYFGGKKELLPYSIATDKSGNAFFAGFSNGVIAKFTKNENKFKGTSVYYFVSKTIIKKLFYDEENSILATASSDNKLGILNFKNEIVYNVSILFRSQIKSIYVDNNGDVFTALADHTFRQFHSDCNKTYKELCGQVKRDLTTEEWIHNFGYDIEYKPLNCKK